MAVSGLFTYDDLYAVKPPNSYPKFDLLTSSSFIPHQHLSVSDISTTTIDPTSYSEKLVASTDIELSTKSNKLADVIPFTYFYWVLVVLAILLTITLIIVFICYCRSFLKTYTARRESLTSFNRYRTGNRRVHAQSIYQPKLPPPPPPPLLHSLHTPPCPSKSLEFLNNQLHGQDFDITSSPQIARLDVYRKGPLSTFTSSTSNIPSALQSQLSIRSSDLPSETEQLYESQRATMALDDDDQLKNGSLIIDID